MSPTPESLPEVPLMWIYVPSLNRHQVPVSVCYWQREYKSYVSRFVETPKETSVQIMKKFLLVRQSNYTSD